MHRPQPLPGFRAPPALAYAIPLLILLACVASRLLKHLVGGDPLFWDFPVYEYAVEAIRANRNPYDIGALQQLGLAAGFNYTYPPVSLTMFRLLDDIHVLNIATFAMLHILSVAYVIYAQVKQFGKRADTSYIFCSVVASLAFSRWPARSLYARRTSAYF